MITSIKNTYEGVRVKGRNYTETEEHFISNFAFVLEKNVEYSLSEAIDEVVGYFANTDRLAKIARTLREDNNILAGLEFVDSVKESKDSLQRYVPLTKHNINELTTEELRILEGSVSSDAVWEHDGVKHYFELKLAYLDGQESVKGTYIEEKLQDRKNRADILKVALSGIKNEFNFPCIFNTTEKGFMLHTPDKVVPYRSFQDLEEAVVSLRWDLELENHQAHDDTEDLGDNSSLLAKAQALKKATGTLSRSEDNGEALLKALNQAFGDEVELLHYDKSTELVISKRPKYGEDEFMVHKAYANDDNSKVVIESGNYVSSIEGAVEAYEHRCGKHLDFADFTNKEYGKEQENRVKDEQKSGEDSSSNVRKKR